MGEDIFDCIELPIYFSTFSSNDLSDFKMLMASRVIGGLGCGMIFTPLPTYMKELLNIKNSSSEIVDILIWTRNLFAIFYGWVSSILL